tara:strand:+ start:46628 stop:46987 length:360 start_codon:yes stop_codon:yes gene_type:complete
MKIFLNCLLKGVIIEYIWLLQEYKKKSNKLNMYTELTPKEIKFIIKSFESELHNNTSKRLVFSKVKRLQNILDKRIKKYQNNTYSEINRYGNLKELRLYQFIVAYKKALENYYSVIIYD